MREEFPWLVPAATNADVATALRSVSADAGLSPLAIDLMGVVRASRALSYEPMVASLVARLDEVLDAFTGATNVTGLSRREDQWMRLRPEGGAAPLPLDEAAALGLVPLSVFSYTERTGEPLVIDEVEFDPRFANDPYFAGALRRSVLAAPIASQGATRAILLLENDATRGAFNVERLDAIMLIGRQLAVSLENARLVESLEQRVEQRTRDLEAAHAEIVATARRAGMAEIANSVLHNVGNVLNSVGTSTSMVAKTLRGSRVGGLAKAVALMKEHEADLGAFMGSDPRGKLVLQYLEELVRAIDAEREELHGELGLLVRNVAHIADIVASQQSHAGASSLVQMQDVHELIDEALHMSATPIAEGKIDVERRFEALPEIALDKPKLLQILVNLIANGVEAMESMPAGQRKLVVACGMAPSEAGNRLRIAVRDQGAGMDEATLERIFAHGFTTKKGGHGFGLHGSVIAAREMNGTLTAASDGIGRGAMFTLDLPAAGAH